VYFHLLYPLISSPFPLLPSAVPARQFSYTFMSSYDDDDDNHHQVSHHPFLLCPYPVLE
jgi:hypothetical protein